jgi:hypothetical protein
MTPLQLIQYYANLLILQYLQQPKAVATVQMMANFAILPQVTVQQISFGTTPTSGTFTLSWTPFGVSQSTTTSASINWNDSASAIQTKLQAMTGLGSVTVSGSVTSTTGLTVTFTGVIPVAPLFVVASNALVTSTITVTQTDVVLPLAVANGFNINAALGPTAVGNQLNIIGKYANVVRSVSLSTGVITLSDADFLALIQFAALKNAAGSDLSSIQTLINTFFSGEVLVFDYKNMQMSYLISTSVGSQNLIRSLVAQNLLFRPMGVSMSVIFNSVITKFFGFRTYTINTINNEPFNNYTTYTLTWPWMSYSMAAKS